MIKSKKPSQHTTPLIRRHEKKPPSLPDDVAPPATILKEKVEELL
jgi:hypothetical protein